MMMNKRLIAMVGESKKYIAGNVIFQWLGMLANILRFFKEKTQAQVAKILGVTQVQVSRIERKILNNMKLKLSS